MSAKTATLEPHLLAPADLLLRAFHFVRLLNDLLALARVSRKDLDGVLFLQQPCYLGLHASEYRPELVPSGIVRERIVVRLPAGLGRWLRGGAGRLVAVLGGGGLLCRG